VFSLLKGARRQLETAPRCQVHRYWGHVTHGMSHARHGLDSAMLGAAPGEGFPSADNAGDQGRSQRNAILLVTPDTREPSPICGASPPAMEAWLSPCSASPCPGSAHVFQGQNRQICDKKVRQLGVSSRHEWGGGRWRWPIATGRGSHFRITWISPAGHIGVGVLHGYWMSRRSTNIHCRIQKVRMDWITRCPHVQLACVTCGMMRRLDHLQVSVGGVQNLVGSSL
jgi:hypothetical protein